MSNCTQYTLFPDVDDVRKSSKATSSTFTDNMKLPVHRWYRYSAGFSAAWVESLIREVKSSSPCDTRVLDPFAGSGTTLLAAEDAAVKSCGIEAHPFISRIAQAKLLRSSGVDRFRKFAARILQNAVDLKPETEHYPPLIHKCYSAQSLDRLDVLRRAVEFHQNDSAEWQLVWLALVSSLRISSYVNTAQWQYILPNKQKKCHLDPFHAFNKNIEMFSRDMRISQMKTNEYPAELLNTDARTCVGVPDSYATLVITSPPYPNNYDYADATRLEMSFFGDIINWGDLQSKIRSRLIRSCSQHVPQKAVDLQAVLASDELEPIRKEITQVCEKLAEIRLTKGGRKTYHLMVACYFFDLSKTWQALRRVCDSPSRLCFVVGDSAPYGVYVPVIEWLGALAMAAGFKAWRFDKTRDRNVKWKNRKHRVPLCEGRLWVDG